jgi:hypothetical protein
MATQERQRGNAARGQQPAVRRPFIVGTRRVDTATYDNSTALTAGTQSLPNYVCDADGFMAGMYILVESSITATATGVVNYGEDAPFAILDVVELDDTNSKPIFGPMTGHDVYLVNKLGGYAHCDDARNNSDSFLLTSGSALAFSFCLRLPVEIVHRDAFGSVPNKSSSATYQLKLRLAAYAAGATFNTVGAQTVSIRTRVQQFGWMDPQGVDIQGNPVQPTPPANSTTQIWDKQDYQGLAAGALNQNLQGLDAMIRNLVFILRDNSASSATAAASATSSATPRHAGDLSWPDPFTLKYETSTPINRLRKVWIHMVGEDYQYSSPRGGSASEAALARDLGVFPETFARDFGLKPGSESRFGYLPANAGTTIKISGTIAAASGTAPYRLTCLANKIAPAGGNARAMASR